MSETTSDTGNDMRWDEWRDGLRNRLGVQEADVEELRSSPVSIVVYGLVAVERLLERVEALEARVRELEAKRTSTTKEDGK